MENEHAHFRLSPEVRRALAMLAAKRRETQSEIVEEALKRYAPMRVMLIGDKNADS